MREDFVLLGQVMPPMSVNQFRRWMRMRHKIEIDESQRQMIVLALARLSNERPGWDMALEVTALCFPGGLDLYKEFQKMDAESVLNAVGGIGGK